MDYISLYALNLGYCCLWMIGWNISYIYWINSFCNEPNLFYGDEKIWVAKIVVNNVLYMFLHLQLAYMELWSLSKNSLY